MDCISSAVLGQIDGGKHRFFLFGCWIHAVLGIFPINAILGAKGVRGPFPSIYEVLFSKVHDFDVHPCIVLQEFHITEERI